jgi:hypothetical protein
MYFNKLIDNALGKIDQRIRSLYYNGNFFRVLSQELLWALHLVTTFMLYRDTIEGGIELLLDTIPERDVLGLLNYEFNGSINKSNWRETKNQKLLEDFYRYDNLIINSYGDLKKIKITISDISDLKARPSLSVFPSISVNIMAKILIPLIVKCCLIGDRERLCSPFDSFIHTEPCRDRSCNYQLRGLVECYSLLSKVEIGDALGNLAFREETFLGKINKLFFQQEEPLCYRKGKSEEGCNSCNLVRPCNLKNLWVKDNIGLTKRIEPNEVINHLFERCREIIPKEVKAKLGFLRYMPEKRGFYEFMGARFIEPLTMADEDEETIKEWLKKKNIRVKPECNLDDLREGLWGDFLTGMDATIKGYDQDLTEEKRLFLTAPALSGLRKIFDLPFFIFMPVVYNGQLLGCIFSNFAPPGETRDNKFHSAWGWQEIKKFQGYFYELSNEFGPLLFHSLIYSFISGIITHYNTRQKRSIHETIIDEIPKMLNISLAAFWEDYDSFRDQPDYVLGFHLAKKSQELSELKRARLSWENYQLKTIYDNDEIKIIELQNEEHLKLPHNYGIKGKEDKKQIKLQTALLMSIKGEELAKQGLKGGVYAFFFERHNKKVLQRNVIEIAREINGIFNIVFLGESRLKIEKERARLKNKNLQLLEIQRQAEKLSHLLRGRAMAITTNIINNIIGGECIFDSTEMQKFFDPDEPIYEMKINGKYKEIKGQHDPFEPGHEDDAKAWLALFVISLLGEMIQENLSPDQLWEKAYYLSSGKSIHTALVSLKEVLMDKKSEFLCMKVPENYPWQQRGHSFLYQLIRVPDKLQGAPTVYSLAARLLMQTNRPDLSVDIYPESGGVIKLKLNNLFTNKASKIFYEPRFPAFKPITAKKWFTHVVDLISKVFNNSEKMLIVKNISIKPLRNYQIGSEIKCNLVAREDMVIVQKDINAIETSLSEEKQIFINQLGNSTHHGNSIEIKKGNFRQKIIKLLGINQQLQENNEGKIDVSFESSEGKYCLIIKIVKGESDCWTT